MTISVQVPQDVPGDGWTWAPWPDHPKVAEEPVYDGTELQHVMRTWGRTVAGIIGKNGPTVFRVVAYGIYSERTIALHIFRWHPELRRYEPDGEPWCIWDKRSAVLADALRREQAA